MDTVGIEELNTYLHDMITVPPSIRFYPYFYGFSRVNTDTC